MAERLNDFALQLHPTDDVAVVRKPIRAGLSLMNGQGPFEAKQDIPQGHKIAVHPIAPGEPVRKYGQIIGFASAAIAGGRPRPCPQPRR
jgi:altronate hydrolase